jgi:hypothetical protein
MVTIPEDYFFSGVAAGAGAVGVTADCSAGFGVSCFWQPMNAKAEIARTTMIAMIFFMSFHPLSSHEITAGRLSQ